MNAVEARTFEMLVRVRDFGQAYGHLFPESSLARQAFASLGDLVPRIEAHYRRKLTTAAVGKAARKGEARKALAEHLARITRTARILGAPGVAEQFALPRRAKDHALLSAARQFAETAAPMADRFIKHGVPPAFLEDLRRQADALETVLRERGMSRDERVDATESIKSLVAAAMAIVRRLDVLVDNHLTGDTVRRALWKLARRIAAARSRPAADKTGAGPAAPAPAASTT